MPQDNQIPLLYLYIHSVLAERFKYSYVHTNYIIEMLNRRLPRFPWCKHNRLLFYAMLKEFEKYHLIIKKNHSIYRILPSSQTKKISQFTSSNLW